MNCQASCRLADFATFQFTILQGLFTFRLHSLFSFLACLNPLMPFLPDNLRHAWHLIDFKRFFLAKTLAKTCQNLSTLPSEWQVIDFKRIFICQMRHELIL